MNQIQDIVDAIQSSMYDPYLVVYVDHELRQLVIDVDGADEFECFDLSTNDENYLTDFANPEQWFSGTTTTINHIQLLRIQKIKNLLS